MEELRNLCENLGLPGEVTERVCSLGADCPWSTEELYDQLSRQSGEQALRESLEDPDGFRMLTYMLLAGLKTWEIYRARNIPEEVFFETFQCFPRFVREHQQQFGRYGFDRSFWTWRQVGLRLFKLGELEFELTELHGASAVSVHIPSTAHLDPAASRASYQRAAAFMRQYEPLYAQAPYFCSSWLLSPALEELLPPDSRILAFQRDYDLREVHPEDSSFLMWVYWRTDLPLEQLPEDTTLRRNLKSHLLRGGKVGSAVGVLRKEFSETSI